MRREYPATSAARIVAGGGLAHPPRPAAAQAREEKLAVLRVAENRAARHHEGGDGAQLRNDLPCLIESSHVGVAGGERAIGRGEVRLVLDREEELWYCLVEAPAEEMREADYVENCAKPAARAEAQ